jgi:uncharacterized membrane protein YagU involved in acid resistance
VLTGALDGAAATIAMSGVMYGAQRAGWFGEMPPRTITRVALRRARAGTSSSRRAKSALGAIAHVAFGASAGSLFEGAHAHWVRRSGVGPIAGAAFGAAVWLLSYAGWVPALDILPPPHRDRPGRQAGMLVAHLVYGAVLGALADRRSFDQRGGELPPELVPSPS